MSSLQEHSRATRAPQAGGTFGLRIEWSIMDHGRKSHVRRAVQSTIARTIERAHNWISNSDGPS